MPGFVVFGSCTTAAEAVEKWYGLFMEHKLADWALELPSCLKKIWGRERKVLEWKEKEEEWFWVKAEKSSEVLDREGEK